MPADELDALEHAVASLGYLGRSESVCTARLLSSGPRRQIDALPAASGDASSVDWDPVELLSIDPLSPDPIAALTVSVTELRKARRLTPPGTVPADYLLRPSVAAVRVAEVGDEPSRPTLAHLRVGHEGRPALTDTAVVTAVLRASLQRRFDHDRSGRRSPIFSGHDEQGAHRVDQHRHAHYLARPGRDGRRIEHLYVWAPEGFGAGEIAAMASLERLRLRDAPAPLQVVLAALGGTGGERPDDERLVLPALLGASSTWSSVTPFMLPRHPKRRGGREVDGVEEQVQRELTWRGMPAAVAITQVTGAWMDFVRTRPGGSRRTAAPAYGLALEFAEAVPGPISLGALSHFGLGLFQPTTA